MVLGVTLSHLPITTLDSLLPGPRTANASLAAREFFAIVTDVFPYPLQCVLTDNGSEFMKHFDEEIRRLHKTHWHTYPRTPKMNAHVERFTGPFRRSSLITIRSC